MASIPATLIMNYGERATYRLRDGSTVTLTLEPHMNSIEVADADGGRIGNMDVRVIENDHGRDTHRITNMYLEDQEGKYKRMGIGRACVAYYNNYFDTVLTAAENDGQQQDDGSHLTGDGVPFIAAMRQAGLVQ